MCHSGPQEFVVVHLVSCLKPTLKGVALLDMGHCLSWYAFVGFRGTFKETALKTGPCCSLRHTPMNLNRGPLQWTWFRWGFEVPIKIHTLASACLPACVPACLRACLPACLLLAYLLALSCSFNHPVPELLTARKAQARCAKQFVF